jgi:hypothetical protein
MLLLLLPVLLRAQDCNPFYAMREGGTANYEYYDAKDKKTSSSTTTIREVKKISGGIEAEVAMTMMDKTGKEMFQGTTRIICRNDTLFMDVGSLINPGLAQSAGKMEMSMTGDGMTIPGYLRAGMQLPDSHNEFSIGMNGMTLMTISIDISEHKVEAEEKVTTPAGTFDCFRVSYVSNSKTTILKTSTRTVQWYSKGVGIVKTESYDKKGGLESRMLLTGLK